MSLLANLIEAQTKQLVQDWLQRERTEDVPPGLTDADLIDHLPFVLGDLVTALREERAPGSNALAKAHGRQRHRLHFDIKVLVREHGLIRNLILNAAEAAGIIVTFTELRVLTVFVDTAVTEGILEYTRCREEQGLLERQELAQFFSMTPDFLAVASFHSGKWTRVNHSMIEALGFDEKELLNKTFVELVHPEDHAMLIEAIVTVAASKTAVSFDNRIACKDGSYRRIAWHASAIAEHGLFVCSGRDMTDQSMAVLSRGLEARNDGTTTPHRGG